MFPLPGGKPAKLYSRFVFSKQINCDGEEVELQFARFVNHENFKWVQYEPRAKHGIYQNDGRLLSNATELHLRTNYQGKIEQDDLVWLIHPLFPEGQYFIVKEPVRPVVMMLPKPRIGFQELVVETINFSDPNFELWKEDEADKEDDDA